MTKHNMTISKRMNFLLLIFVCLVVVVFSIEAQEALPDLVARIKPSVVSIITYDKDSKKVAGGSGFCIAQDRIITNKHVIEDAFRIFVHITDGKIYRVIKIESVDTEGDLALLQTEQLVSQVKPLTIAKLSPRVGEKVFVVGNPLGLEGSVSDGIVAAFRSMQGIGKLIQITAPISPGSSGSPVINIWGEVIGVATLNLEGGQNLNFAISSERILSLWSNQLTISSNTYSNLPRSSINNVSGKWKSESRYLSDQSYETLDNGIIVAVRVFNKDSFLYSFEVKWEGDFAFGTAPAVYGKLVLVLKRTNSGQLYFSTYSPKKSKEQIKKMVDEQIGITNAYFWTRIS